MKSLLAALLWVFSASFVQAQTATPTLDNGLTGSAQLLFPEALRLELAIPLPSDQVVSTTLTIAAPTGTPLTINFPTNQAYRFAEEYVIATYEYRFPVLPPLQLFSEIRYRWQVQTSTGETLNYTGEVTYEDTRLNWNITRAADDKLIFAVGDGATFNVTSVANDLATLLVRLEAETDFDTTLRFLVYPNDITMGCAQNADEQPINRYLQDNSEVLVPCNATLAEQVFSSSGYEVLQLTNPTQFVVALKQSLVTSAYSRFWDTSDVPGWFTTGITNLYVPTGGDNLGAVRQQLRTGQTFNLSQLQTVPINTNERGIWIAQSNTLTSYLLATYGVPPVLQLAQDVATSPSFAEAYGTAFGSNLNVLLLSWQNWLYTTDADVASSYSIYQPNTPTPTPTFTPSPTRIPPTASDTPTPTEDNSPTPRPTRTRIPPTPTITPLPAESFVVRDTPVPTAISSTQNNGGTFSTLPLTPIVIGVGVLLVIVLLVAFIVAGRRR